jgi:predicted MPP superfamily phosphohydrolase
LTDLHRSWCVPARYIAEVVSRTNALGPDVVLLTGDFVTRTSSYIRSCSKELAGLKACLGVFGVLGNHDYWCDDAFGAVPISNALRSAGVRLLINRSFRLPNGLYVVGIDDAHAGCPDLDRSFAGIPARAPRIAMTHNPMLYADACRYDCITLAGHTHGGQVMLPYITASLLGYPTATLSGWWSYGDRPGRMYVSRGLGVVGVPLRFNCSPEIAVFDLSPA